VLQNEAACSAALNTAALTMFATSVTTGASFLSNLVAYVAPVRLLGVFAACTVASCYVMTVRRPLGRASLRSAPRDRMGARCAVPLRRATLALVQAAGTLLRCVRVCCMPLFCCVRRICCALQRDATGIRTIGHVAAGGDDPAAQMAALHKCASICTGACTGMLHARLPPMLSAAQRSAAQ
jgi:hypothetical protein